MSYLEGLNSQQHAAVMHDGGHLLIVAGPGTGKTRTLVARICRLASLLSPGEKTLAITFTNNAAGELAARLEREGIPFGRYEAATFHAFALNLLRRYHARLKFPLAFSVVTPDDVELMAAEFWPDVPARERRARLRRVSAWKASLAPASDDPDVLAFRAFLREKECVDFDDILRDVVFLLRDEADICAEVRRTYRHILVDEYQDMNLMQEELLKLLVAEGVTLSAIGDPNQAIYGFRGSDASLFEHFPRVFSPCTVLALEKNYRSSENLLSASTQVIACGPRLNVPELTAQIHTQGLLKEHEAYTDRAEASYVAREIESIIGGTGFAAHDAGRSGDGDAHASFGDIAVLYRLNAQAKLFVEVFEKAGIPYRVSGEKAVPGGVEDVYAPRAEKVSLMTLHAAKGLEFPVVFIVGCEEGLIPLDLDFFSGDLEEERRLFYVGMTRAQRMLYLVRAQKRMLYGKSVGGAPSKFLADIASGLKVYDEESERDKIKRRLAREQMELF